MNTNKDKEKFFVVYQITNLLDGRIYVGAHSTYNVNDKYMGSSTPLKKDMKNLGRINFKKEILYILGNKKDMMAKEAEIVNRKFCHRPDTYNMREGGKDNFTTTGMLCAKDKNGNRFHIYKDDPRYLSGELVGITKNNIRRKNKVNVKDKNGNTYQVDVTDPRYLSGEFVHVATGNKNPNKIGYPVSAENKKKLSDKAKLRIGEKAATFGTYWINNGVAAKIIKKEELNIFLEQGWFKGRKLII